MTWNLTTATAKMRRADRALRRLTGRAWPHHIIGKGRHARRRASMWRQVYMRCLEVGMRHWTAPDLDAVTTRIIVGAR